MRKTHLGTFPPCPGHAYFWLKISAVIWLAGNTSYDVFTNLIKEIKITVHCSSSWSPNMMVSKGNNYAVSLEINDRHQYITFKNIRLISVLCFKALPWLFWLWYCCWTLMFTYHFLLVYLWWSLIMVLQLEDFIFECILIQKMLCWSYFYLLGYIL